MSKFNDTLSAKISVDQFLINGKSVTNRIKRTDHRDFLYRLIDTVFNSTSNGITRDTTSLSGAGFFEDDGSLSSNSSSKVASVGSIRSYVSSRLSPIESSLDPASIKNLYESNADTNVFSDYYLSVVNDIGDPDIDLVGIWNSA